MKKKKQKTLLIISIINIILIGIYCYFWYANYYLDKKSNILIQLNGSKEITLGVASNYEEQGAKATYRKENITKKIKVTGNVDTTKVGTYTINYSVQSNNKNASTYRTIKVIDNVAPVITLIGDEQLYYTIGEEYEEQGCIVTDNYDENLQEKVVITNYINKAEAGEYSVEYKVTDSAGNIATAIRKVIYKKPVLTPMPSESSSATRIAVLNYHVFSDPTIGEAVGNGNYISVQSFEEQLVYLRDNNYKTLTMEEFRAWMYGEITLPARSVLITVDDGALGTGFHNGNKLIPLLEKYQMHATLFLITGWWDINNYRSEYLDIESHTNNMHEGNACEGVARGAQMLCYDDETVLNDLKQSIAITGSNRAFCFPFYAYDGRTIGLVQNAGFQLAFIGGGYKATQSTDKFKIPRYHIYRTTTIAEFHNMIA